jgi:alpha-mannosidase
MKMHQLDARLRRMLEELTRLTTRKSTPVEEIFIAERGTDDFKPFVNGSEWGLTGEWWDFRFAATVPADYKGRVTLNIRTGREGGWEATNPQFPCA